MCGSTRPSNLYLIPTLQSKILRKIKNIQLVDKVIKIGFISDTKFILKSTI